MTKLRVFLSFSSVYHLSLCPSRSVFLYPIKRKCHWLFTRDVQDVRVIIYFTDWMLCVSGIENQKTLEMFFQPHAFHHRKMENRCKFEALNIQPIHKQIKQTQFKWSFLISTKPNLITLLWKGNRKSSFVRCLRLINSITNWISKMKMMVMMSDDDEDVNNITVMILKLNRIFSHFRNIDLHIIPELVVVQSVCIQIEYHISSKQIQLFYEIHQSIVWNCCFKVSHFSP